MILLAFIIKSFTYKFRKLDVPQSRCIMQRLVGNCENTRLTVSDFSTGYSSRSVLGSKLDYNLKHWISYYFVPPLQWYLEEISRECKMWICLTFYDCGGQAILWYVKCLPSKLFSTTPSWYLYSMCFVYLM